MICAFAIKEKDDLATFDSALRCTCRRTRKLYTHTTSQLLSLGKLGIRRMHNITCNIANARSGCLSHCKILVCLLLAVYLVRVCAHSSWKNTTLAVTQSKF